MSLTDRSLLVQCLLDSWMVDTVLALELVPDRNTRFIWKQFTNDSKISSPLRQRLSRRTKIYIAVRSHIIERKKKWLLAGGNGTDKIFQYQTTRDNISKAGDRGEGEWDLPQRNVRYLRRTISRICSFSNNLHCWWNESPPIRPRILRALDDLQHLQRRGQPSTSPSPAQSVHRQLAPAEQI